VTWNLQTLRDRLANKHRETFFVGARVRKEGSTEFFHYIDATHTRNPLIQNFDLLIAQGIVTMDFTIKRKPSGGAGDHGFLFKIAKKNRSLLLPTVRQYDLTQ
jgi:hypothetical protein